MLLWRKSGPPPFLRQGRAVGGALRREKQNPAGEGCGFGWAGFDMLSDGKAREPKRAG